MKKILVAFLALIVCSGALFAAQGRIGVTLTPEWTWYTDTEADDGETNISLMAEGANYFGKEGGIGIEYGVGIFMPVNTWLGDNTFDAEGDSAFIFKVGAGYKLVFSDMFGLDLGMGIRGRVQAYADGGSWGSVTISGRSTSFIMDLYGSVAADITLLDFLGINAGVMVGGPVLHSVTTSASGSIGDFGGNTSDTSTVDTSGFWLAPFVGVSFVY